MKLHLHARLYCLIWRIVCKRRVEINGYDITYCRLPWWLLVGDRDSKERFPGGMCITRRNRKQLFLFISSKKKPEEERYVVYHEYLEGNCWLDNDRARMTELFREALESFQEDAPDMAIRISESLDKKEDRVQHAFHLFALAMELALAKKEMSSARFSTYLATAIRDRL